jgi:hypothetical protein
MTTTPHPLRSKAARLASLRNFLRPLNTAGMEPEELFKQCRNAVPDAKIDEVVTALRQTAAEHNAEADQLQAYETARKGGQQQDP